MHSPYFWRNLILLLLTAANVVVSVMVVRRVRGIGRTAGAMLYFTLACVVLLLCLSIFDTLETSAEAEACWRRNSLWAQVRPGMTTPQVKQLLGEPSGAGFGFTYRLHPLSYGEGSIQFDDKGTVTGKHPLQGAPWLTPGWTSRYLSHAKDDLQPIGFLGLGLLALVSIIPLRMRSGVSSWQLYTPVIALVLGALYEATMQGGWRFDWFFLFPAYAVILLAWLVRVRAIRKS